MMLRSEQILQELAKRRAALRELGARKLGLFGSRVRGEAKEESDLDFVVEFEPGRKSFDNYMDLRFLLEDLFERRIDLVILGNIKERLRESILRETVYVPGLCSRSVDVWHGSQCMGCWRATSL